jgi:hypothetical protein
MNCSVLGCDKYAETLEIRGKKSNGIFQEERFFKKDIRLCADTLKSGPIEML